MLKLYEAALMNASLEEVSTLDTLSEEGDWPSAPSSSEEIVGIFSVSAWEFTRSSSLLVSVLRTVSGEGIFPDFSICFPGSTSRFVIPAGTFFKKNSPASLVVVEFPVPGTETLVLGDGLPFSSVTIPFIVYVCAKMHKGKNKKRKESSRLNF